MKLKMFCFFNSTRKTKLIDSVYELHFTDSTAILQVNDLTVDLLPLYTFQPLSKIPDFVPFNDSASASLCVRGKYGYQTTHFTRLTCNPQLEATDSLLKEITDLSHQQLSTLPYPEDTSCLRKESISLTTISQLRSSTQHAPLPGQDQHYSIKATVTRISNESTLTYRCCPICWTALYEDKSYPYGCPKINCSNKQAHSTQRFRSNVEVSDRTGRITLTLFEQPSEDLFNISSSDINKLKTQPDAQTKISSIAQAVINRRFIFHVKVTSANHQFISNVYARGYTTESIEWLPRTYDPDLLTQIQTSASLSLPPGPLDKGKSIADEDITPSHCGTPTTSESTASDTPTISASTTSASTE